MINLLMPSDAKLVTPYKDGWAFAAYQSRLGQPGLPLLDIGYVTNTKSEIVFSQQEAYGTIHFEAAGDTIAFLYSFAKSHGRRGHPKMHRCLGVYHNQVRRATWPRDCDNELAVRPDGLQVAFTQNNDVHLYSNDLCHLKTIEFTEKVEDLSVKVLKLQYSADGHCLLIRFQRGDHVQTIAIDTE